jgi:hypothetical protein
MLMHLGNIAEDFASRERVKLAGWAVFGLLLCKTAS